MLANNETVQGVNRAEVFSRMLEELPWAGLRSYLQANAQLLKLATLGGHRLDPKKRNRVEKILLKEAEKAEFSQTFCNGLFAVWYPVHEELHKSLEEYFHSDEYKAYREEKELEDDVYVLPDEIFERVYKVEDLPKWHTLLCFSPLRLSESQAARLTDQAEGNTTLIGKIEALEAKLEELGRERTRLDGENTRLREQFDQANTTALDLRKSVRELRAERDSLEKSQEGLQAENRNLRQRVDQVETRREEDEAELTEELKRTRTRLENDVKRYEEQLTNWQSMYEQQRVENRGLERDIAKAQSDKRVAELAYQEARREADALNQFADLILGRFDWPKVGQALKLTPTIKRQFNSLVKNLNYEADRSLSIEGTLDTFWGSLMAKEKALVENIVQSNTREVESGAVFDYWQGLTDTFEDVRIGLEARLILLKMLHEIFYQIIDMKDLEVPELPKN